MTDTHGHAAPHVMSTPLLAGVLAALLALTGATVALAELGMGRFDLTVAMTIATAKAALVALYFMHLRHDRPLHGLIVVVSLFLVALFIGVACLDTAQYAPEVARGARAAAPRSAP